MEAIYEYLLAFNPVTVVIRVLLAALAGALVGLEREFHGRAAGMRTHMMVALGAALTAMIGMFTVNELGISSDPLRVGAQVISGVGFLGAGTILLRGGGSRITGLTTAAGLWTAASIGLAVGIGFYVGAFMTVFAVMFTFTLVTRIEMRLNRKRQRMAIYLELEHVDAVRPMLDMLRTEYGLMEAQVTPPRSGTPPHVGMEILVRVPQKLSTEENLRRFSDLPRVVFALRNI
ncbi:MAG: MgtC/SapB family protein [Clostridia bacterium]|nr:MgtC/SapB family protein [Clostridia bacterium]